MQYSTVQANFKGVDFTWWGFNCGIGYVAFVAPAGAKRRGDASLCLRYRIEEEANQNLMLSQCRLVKCAHHFTRDFMRFLGQKQAILRQCIGESHFSLETRPTRTVPKCAVEKANFRVR